MAERSIAQKVREAHAYMEWAKRLLIECDVSAVGIPLSLLVKRLEEVIAESFPAKLD